MPLYMKRIILALAVSMSIATLLPVASAHAKGERYVWADAAQTQIKASGGLYADGAVKDVEVPSLFTRVEALTNETSGIYEYSNIAGDAQAPNGLDDTDINGKCRITISTQSGGMVVTPSLCYGANGADNSDAFATIFDNRGGNGLSGQTFGELTIGEYVDTSLQNARESAAITALYDTFGGKLDDLMYTYYTGFDNPPCSSQGCNSAPWKENIYVCWTNARQNAASSARYERDVDTDALTKSNFATCLSNKSNGAISSTDILNKIRDISVGALNNAYSTAADAAEVAELTTRCEDERGTYNTQTGACDFPPDETASSCGIDGIGWIVCPVMTFLSKALDTSFNFLATNFLSTDVNKLTNDKVTTAWGVMRNLANVVFVIVFLIIIFSQLTGAGVSNYGVKKTLPRLVIAAILVNLSYYVCLISVDVSNILGYGVRGVFESISGIAVPNASGATEGNSFIQVSGILLAVLAGAAGAVALALSISGPVLIAALLALIMIILILIGRTALIIILTIVSPLAFVAFLLPNTEKWFKKWYKTFWTLLLLFPLIAVVFGASSLASTIVYETANGDRMMQVISIGVAAIPLFIVPSMLKGALSATGSMGAKLSGLANKAGGKVGGKVRDTSRLGETAKNMRYNSALRRANGRSGNGSTARLGGYVADKFSDTDGRIGVVGRKLGATLGFAGTLGSRFDKSRAGKALGTDKGSTAAQAAVDTDFDKSVQESSKLLERQYSGNNEALLGIANDGSASEEMRVAARRRVMATGSYDEKKKALMSIGARSSVREKSDMNAQYFSSGMNKYFGNKLGAAAFSATGTGVGDAAQLQRSMIENFSQMEAETVAKSGAPAMLDIADAAQAATPAELSALTHIANSIISNKDLKPVSSGAQEHFDRIVDSLTAPPRGGPTP